MAYEGDSLPVTVYVRRDKRLRKSARWSREGGRVLLRVPVHLSRRQVDRLVLDVVEQLQKQRDRAQRLTDADLQARAEHINRRYFNGTIQWESIRWVSNMNKRLGSCTNGGPTDGHIRISDKIRDWPEWVIDYVIAHELAHRRYGSHSRAFWDYLRASYPLTERARGFIQGVGFSQGASAGDEEEG
ncbi:MAG: M48 family metallopeptidase [Anaerolineae bacterium]